jgi:23S rRNA-/tRNA-specific pseudouridylate synthase
MKKHGVPILGDVLYGGQPLATANRIALRAVVLDLSALQVEARMGLPIICKIAEM